MGFNSGFKGLITVGSVQLYSYNNDGIFILKGESRLIDLALNSPMGRSRPENRGKVSWFGVYMLCERDF
jgi:hypothetical protein